MRTLNFDPTLEAIAYRSGYAIAYDYVWMARATGGTIDLERFRDELPLVVDVGNPHVRQGVEDALAGRPGRW
jgi:hypothetical protein